MEADEKSIRAFERALSLVEDAKDNAETDAELDRLVAQENSLIAARRADIVGEFASRTFYFNFIAGRLSAVSAGLNSDPLKDIKMRVQAELLQLRREVMDTAVEVLNDVNQALVVGNPDEIVEPAGAAEPAHTGLTSTDEVEAASPPVVAAPPNATVATSDKPCDVRADLKADYETLFAECVIRPERQSVVNWYISQLTKHKAKYEETAHGVDNGVPWWFVGGIHMMETGSRFSRHLHNGGPLTAKTVHVPANRPDGEPPFIWEFSAQDAIRHDKLDQWTDLSVAGALFKWESFNGMGYRNFHPEVKSPYLWSFSQVYTQGKYVGDGDFDPAAKSGQSKRVSSSTSGT